METTLELHLIDQTKALQFILAGKSLFTVENKVSKKRFTFLVQKAKSPSGDKQMYFCKCCDSNGSYRFFGTIIQNTITKQVYFKYSAKADQLPQDTIAVVAFDHIINKIFSLNKFNTNMNVWHRGLCCRCGKVLRTPESIQLGIGPECIKKFNKSLNL